MVGAHYHHPHFPQRLSRNGIDVNSWHVATRKGPIISDKDTDDFRAAVGPNVVTLPEMLFSSSRVTFLHKPSGIALDFTALSGLRAWVEEGLPPLEVRVAQEWQAARQHEISAQKAVKLEYDWTYTTPYAGTVTTQQAAEAPMGPGDTGARSAGAHSGLFSHGAAALAAASAAASTAVAAATTAAASAASAAVHSLGAGGSSTAASTSPAGEHVTASGNVAPAAQQPAQQAGQDGIQGADADGASSTTAQLPEWEDTTDQIDRSLLMERDPILLFDEVVLYESDLDDNGVSQLSVKLRVMPRAWLVLLRFWLRVDGCMVRLRETRFFCRHDTAASACVVIREQRWCEGAFTELRSQGAPGEGPAWADGDTAAQAFQAAAPIGLKLLKVQKLVLPSAGVPGS